MAVNSSKYFNINEGAVDTTDYFAGIEPKIFDENMSIMECTYIALIENETNWNRINSTLALNELNYLKENGQEIVYEAANIKDFIEVIVKAAKHVFEKIMGLLEKAKDAIDRRIVGNSKYLEANKKYIELGMKNIPADANLEGYDCAAALARFDSFDPEINLYKPIMDKANAIISRPNIASSESEAAKAIEEMKDDVQKLIFDTASRASGKKITKEEEIGRISSTILGEKENLFDTVKGRVAFLTSDLKLGVEYKKRLNEMTKNVKKAYNSVIKELNSYENKVTKQSSEDQQYGVLVAHSIASELNNAHSVCTTLLGTFATLINADVSQNIKLASKLITYGKIASKAEENKEDVKKESTLFGDLELV